MAPHASHNSSPRPPRRRFRTAAVLLLAMVCIAGAELLACRAMEPELYEEITAPVRRGAAAAARAGGAVWDWACEAGEALWTGVRETGETLRLKLEELNRPPEPQPEEALSTQLEQPDIAPPYSMLDPLISDLEAREDGLEYLTGGGVDVVYFNQTDEARSGQKYGSDPLSSHGCGPTAMAMAVSTLTETTVDPEDMARLCVKRGYWCRSHGSYLSIVQGVAEAYGLICEPLDPALLDEDALYARLAGGDLAVALMTDGHFTKGGHFILLRGVTLGGEILVADPASRERSLIPWDLSLILEELSPSRTNGAPLWILSRAGEVHE